ncbi:MAG: hypothetical protein ACXVJD_02650 [Mucilaginibacter sp.]
MRIKTIVIILITVLLTIALMQNTEPVYFNFLWASFRMSKLVLLFIIGLISFVLGFLVGRPKRIKKLGGDFIVDDQGKENTGTLSDEDREYIN